MLANKAVGVSYRPLGVFIGAAWRFSPGRDRCAVGAKHRSHGTYPRQGLLTKLTVRGGSVTIQKLVGMPGRPASAGAGPTWSGHCCRQTSRLVA